MVALSGDISAASVSEFIKTEKLPLSLEFNNENSDKIFNSGINKQVGRVSSRPARDRVPLCQPMQARQGASS